jgi:hypothetical protein
LGIFQVTVGQVKVSSGGWCKGEWKGNDEQHKIKAARVNKRRECGLEAAMIGRESVFETALL